MRTTRAVPTLFRTTGKVLVVAITTSAAIFSIVTNGREMGLISQSVTQGLTPADLAVSRVYLSPPADTCFSLGDTVHFAATVSDKHGVALVGAWTRWRSEDTTVAVVDTTGAAVAVGPGATDIVVQVGEHFARSPLAVQQHVSGVWIARDSSFHVGEHERRSMVAQATDLRGHLIEGRVVTWRSADSAVATVTQDGQVTGVRPGRTTLIAMIEGRTAEAGIEVVPVPGALQVVAGSGQRAPVGRKIPNPIVAQVFSRGGLPMAGISVRFVPSESNDGVEPAMVMSNQGGVVHGTWTLGATPGRQHLTLSIEGVDSVVTVTAEADPLRANTRIGGLGDSLAGVVGETLPQSVGVRVTDSLGVALADIPVAWKTMNGGTIFAANARTDSLGEARVQWVLGPKAGMQRALVQVGNPRIIPPFTLMARAEAGGPAALAVTRGKDQVGAVNAPLAQAIVFQVTDQHGNPVAGASVRLQPESGDVSDPLPITDQTGKATVRWTLGRKAGSQRLTARVQAIDAVVTVAARGRPLGAANLAVSGPASGALGQPLSAPLRILATDAYGNPVADVQVALSTSTGTVAPVKVMTDDHGVAQARWTLGSKAGEHQLKAMVKGTDAQATWTVRAGPTVKPVVAGSTKAKT